jgi:uncharacterized membrane protein YfcA
VLRPPRTHVESTAQKSTEFPLPWSALATIGAIAGWPSGFFGYRRGLWIGTDVGARLANRVKPARLRMVLMIVIAGMATFMAFRAWG